MKSPKFSGKPKRRKLFFIRRVVGESMLPTLKPRQLILVIPVRIQPGDVVLIRHKSLEKVKRLHQVQHGQIFVIGDNPLKSTDSRSFGWLPEMTVLGKVIWPRYNRNK